MPDLYSLLQERVIVCAEIGINHNGDLEQAKRLVAAAAECGADAVKFQAFRAEHLLSRRHPGFAHTDADVFAQLRALSTGDGWWAELRAEAERNRLLFSASVFDEESLRALTSAGIDFVKVASSEINHFQLLEKVLALSDVVVVSTGMALLQEIAACVRFLEGRGLSKIVLLECTTSYPAPPESIHLLNIDFLRDTFGLPVGFSDHAVGTWHALAAVARGARFIEKHFTLDCRQPGPDHALSADVTALRDLVTGIRQVERSLRGNRKRVVSGAEEQERRMGRRSVVACRDIAGGEMITRENTALKRPGLGVAPDEAHRLYGRRARAAIESEQWITWEMVE